MEHTVKVNQFEHVTYMHQGKEKKLQLLSKMMTMTDLVNLLKVKE